MKFTAMPATNFSCSKPAQPIYSKCNSKSKSAQYAEGYSVVTLVNVSY